MGSGSSGSFVTLHCRLSSACGCWSWRRHPTALLSGRAQHSAKHLIEPLARHHMKVLACGLFLGQPVPVAKQQVSAKIIWKKLLIAWHNEMQQGLPAANGQLHPMLDIDLVANDTGSTTVAEYVASVVAKHAADLKAAWLFIVLLCHKAM